MTNVNVRALAQQETVMEKEYREVFLKEGEHRFSIEYCSSNQNKQSYNLYSVSKPRAEQEAILIIEDIMQKNNYERLAWRMVSSDEKSSWVMTAGSQTMPPSRPKEKSESIFSRLFDWFFLPEDY